MEVYGAGERDTVDNWEMIRGMTVTAPGAVNGINNTGQLNGVVQISVGYVHSCALGSNGQVSCWGDNDDHKLGHDGANTKSGYPRTVNISRNGPPLEGIVQIPADSIIPVL